MLKKTFYQLLGITILLGVTSCDKILVNTDSGTRIEVKVTVNGEPATGVHAFLYESSADCSADDTGASAFQEAISTDDDAVFGELDADKTYNIKVQTGDLTSSCRSITTKLDEMVTLTVSM